MNKIYLFLALNLVVQFGKSQSYLLTDLNNVINPLWLQPENFGKDSSERVWFDLLEAGIDPLFDQNIKNKYAESYTTNLFVHNYLYVGRLQFNITLEEEVKLRRIIPKYDTLVANYLPANTFRPSFAVAWYPKIFGNSYLSNQLRLKLSYEPIYSVKQSYDKITIYDTIPPVNTFHEDTIRINRTSKKSFRLIYGGYLNNPKVKSKFPRTAILTQAHFSFATHDETGEPTADSTNNLNYFIGAAVALHDFKSSSVLRTIYLQAGYHRIIENHMDRFNLASFYLFFEIRYGMKSNSSFFLYTSYDLESKDQIDERNVLSFGAYFAFPVVNSLFYNSLK